MANEKCDWYAEYEGVCTNADCPYCAEWCPIGGELGSICRFDSRPKNPKGNKTWKRHDNSVAVKSISPDGEVKHYPSMKAAAQAIGASAGHLYRAVNFGETCHGMVWKKVGEDDG